MFVSAFFNSRNLTLLGTVISGAHTLIGKNENNLFRSMVQLKNTFFSDIFGFKQNCAVFLLRLVHTLCSAQMFGSTQVLLKLADVY